MGLRQRNQHGRADRHRSGGPLMYLGLFLIVAQFTAIVSFLIYWRL